MTIEVTELPAKPPEWDREIQRFDGKTIFHESCWLDHVASIHPGNRVIYTVLKDQDTVVGYLPAIRRRFGILPVLATPLPGTGTNYMGPLIEAHVPMDQALDAILRWCRRTHVMQLEMSHPLFTADQAAKAGLELHDGVTHMIPLTGGEAKVWAGLKGTCRNRIRKAEKNGLIVEVTSDPTVADRFYEEYVEVYAKQGLVLPFGPERGHSLFRHLMPAGRVLPIWVKYQGEVVAAGLFPFDQHAIYFWGAASWMRFQHLCPNELLHWTVMKLAIERGIESYNMCGGTSQFKDKFGGSDVPHVRFSRSFAPGLGAMRKLYRAMHRGRMRLKGLLQKKPTAEKADSDAAE